MTQTQRSSPVARDAVGAATLQHISRAPAFNRWMFDRLSRWIGSRVLEVGSGIGNMSRFFIDRERVVLTDTEAAYRAVLEEKYGARENVDVVNLSLPEVPGALSGQDFDTIVCLNVLEHIDDDVASLQAMYDMMQPAGRLVLLVPAFPALYGTHDRALGHYRRYTRKLLRARYASAGFAMRHLEYFNLAGMPGWWVTGRVLRRDLIPTGSLALYDMLVPLFRLERLIPFRVGQSLIAIGERPE
jgi:SAM-dependent methyltransferase